MSANTKLLSFQFAEQKLHVLMISDQPWFISQQACGILNLNLRKNGSVNVHPALQKLSHDEKRNLPYVETKRIGLQSVASRAHGLSIISESGLYRLIMRSDKPEARKFPKTG